MMALVNAQREESSGANYAVLRPFGELPFEGGVLPQAMMNVLLPLIRTLTVALKQHSLTRLERTPSSRVSQ